MQDVLAEALKAADRSPPAHEDLMSSWLATIARRVVADFLAQRARRAKYEGDMPDEPEGEPGAPDGAAGVEASEDDEPPAFPEPSYDPRAAGDDEGEVDAWLVRQWLEKQVAGDPRDEETLAILLEHAQGEKTYQAIARERGMTLPALSNRIFEFKSRYIPRYKRWRNRAVLLLVLGGVAIVAEIVLCCGSGWRRGARRFARTGTGHPRSRRRRQWSRRVRSTRRCRRGRRRRPRSQRLPPCRSTTSPRTT